MAFAVEFGMGAITVSFIILNVTLSRILNQLRAANEIALLSLPKYGMSESEMDEFEKGWERG